MNGEGIALLIYSGLQLLRLINNDLISLQDGDLTEAEVRERWRRVGIDIDRANEAWERAGR